MSLSNQLFSALDQIWVSLDLETTGLDSKSDEVIEVGAVKFRGPEVLDTYRSFVNPYKRLSDFIVGYTGITQKDVDQGPPLAVVSGELASFIGSFPIIGHNVAFDVGFLEKKGLSLTNQKSDTWDLAFVFLPEAPEYALGQLASHLGIKHPQPHRALPDAAVTHQVFIKLIEKGLELNESVLAEIQRLASRTKWVIDYPLAGMLADKQSAHGRRASRGSLGGFDSESLMRRLSSPDRLVPNRDVERVDAEVLSRILGPGGAISKVITGYESRQEQMEMMRAVASAINERKHLLVEGGTGVGKSLAYLLPSAMHSLKNGQRVVISTNTINLQEQLINKDIPAVVMALKEDGQELGEFYATTLKGRANYLCLKRWAALRSGDDVSQDEARLLAKVLVWLGDTDSGDKTELNLAGRSEFYWDRLSAQQSPDCPIQNGPCFLKAARERAEAANLVVVNHALLLTDMAMGGGLIPEYDTVVIDEAHHLEEEATKHLGFQLAQGNLEEHLNALLGQNGLLQRALNSFRGSSAAEARRNSVSKEADELFAETPRTKDSVARLYGSLQRFVMSQDDRGGEGDSFLRMTPSKRKQPGWSEVEVAFDNANSMLQSIWKKLQGLQNALGDLQDANLLDYKGLMAELTFQIQSNAEIREKLSEFIFHAKEDHIYWLSRERRDGTLTMNAAPLHVGELLEELLFSRKGSVILTSATLSSEGTLKHIRQRVGLSDGDELIQGSPFDYKRAALVCAPEDMPEPSTWSYQAALEQAIIDVAASANGRTLVLFTSHASLQAAASPVRSALTPKGIQVLAQGIDGPPKRLAANFLRNPKSVILGTSSFWEGVDLSGGALKALVLVRLPFSVPTDPVFQARSELYEDAFNQYAVPQAVLRFRQGFGRLIRSKADRGVVVVLDRRLTSRQYGKAFLNSLPNCTIKRCGLREIAVEVSRWIGK